MTNTNDIGLPTESIRHWSEPLPYDELARDLTVRHIATAIGQLTVIEADDPVTRVSAVLEPNRATSRLSATRTASSVGLPSQRRRGRSRAPRPRPILPQYRGRRPTEPPIMGGPQSIQTRLRRTDQGTWTRRVPVARHAARGRHGQTGRARSPLCRGRGRPEPVGRRRGRGGDTGRARTRPQGIRAGLAHLGGIARWRAPLPVVNSPRGGDSSFRGLKLPLLDARCHQHHLSHAEAVVTVVFQ